MSNSLEKLCQQQGLSYARDSDGLRIIASNHYPEAGHSIKISLMPNGRVGILILFPECKSKEIANVADFCGEVQKYFASEVTLSFDDVGKYFFMYGVAESSKLKDYIGRLTHDCDLIKPLLESVGEQGYCNPYGIWLAHLRPSTMGKHPQ